MNQIKSQTQIKCDPQIDWRSEWEKILNLPKVRAFVAKGDAQQLIISRWSEIVENIARGVPVTDIAEMLKIGRRTIYKVFQMLGIDANKIKQIYACKEMVETMKKMEKQMKKAERLPICPELPFFEELESIKKVKEMLKTKTKPYRTSIISRLYKIFKSLNINPDHLIENKDRAKEVLEKFIRDYIDQLGELAREPSVASKISDEIITPLRIFAHANGFTIAEKTIEYQGIWNVYFDREERHTIMEILDQIKKDKRVLGKRMRPSTVEKYVELTKAVIKFIFYTGTRAKGLTTVVEHECKEDYCLVETTEKGKRFLLKWVKIVPREVWYELKKFLPITDKDLRKIRQILVEAYRRLYKLEIEDVKLIQEATLLGENGTPRLFDVLKKYGKKPVYAIRHPMHIWRHTAAISFLKAYQWNYALAARVLGWKSIKVLQMVYGEMPIEQALSIIRGEYRPEPWVF